MVDAEDVGRGQRVVDDALDDGSRQRQCGAHQHGQNGPRHPVLPDVEIVGQQPLQHGRRRLEGRAQHQRQREADDGQDAQDRQIFLRIVH